MLDHMRGSIVAIVTPMQPDGSLDMIGLNALLEWHIASGTNAVVIVGTTGESATLSTDEHCDLVAHCVNEVNGRIPVIAGAGSNNTAEALYFTESARRMAQMRHYWLRLITIDLRRKACINILN